LLRKIREKLKSKATISEKQEKFFNESKSLLGKDKAAKKLDYYVELLKNTINYLKFTDLTADDIHNNFVTIIYKMMEF